MDFDKNIFDHRKIEAKWGIYWEKTKQDVADIARAKRPYYNLMMYPYPSAEGLHIGNMYAFTGADIYGRYMRMQGYDVFEPIGLDGFGIHSENYALKVGRHPKEHAALSEKNFYRQLHTIGACFDWTRTVETYHPDYYRWTQWLFTKMFEHGLAYRAKAPVMWCGNCKTVLSDEQVVVSGGDKIDVCERCGNKVEKRSMEQWFFKITAYAEMLLSHLPELDWSEKVKKAQEQWIGKKDGITITYSVVNGDGKEVGSVECFTTRPDTNFGATFVVMAPEHQYIPYISKYVSKDIQVKINNYIQISQKKSNQNRIVKGGKKTGVFTGLYCLNELNGYKMPLYISDFVLVSFGTGIVVGVPGHDVRDFDFAQAMRIPVVRVVVGKDGDRGPITKREHVQEDEGTMVNSGFFNGLDIHEATKKMMDYVEHKGWGKRVTTYHLRDWTISRQRYWGAPIPMIYCEKCTWVAVPEKDLPVLLPDIADYKPRDDGVGPLAKHKEFYETICPKCGSPARRETDVCDTFLDSSWYYLRYPSVASETAHSLPFDPKIMKKWLPVDMYTGGAEHSVLHLMYARFITMALHDMGYIDCDEPFTSFFAHGLVIKEGAKMSKSKGNIVTPDEYIGKYGADALRMYLMFMGPFADGGDFWDTGMEGMHRFLGRVWRLVTESANKMIEHSDATIHKALQRAIARATDDIAKRRYNTTMAGFMEFVNAAQKNGGILGTGDAKDFVKILAPFAPYITEELWFRLCGAKTEGYVSVHKHPWPKYEKSLLLNSSIQFVVQVNGKIRETLTVTPEQGNDQKMIKDLAEKSGRMKKYLTTRPQKIVFIPGKLVNFVIPQSI